MTRAGTVTRTRTREGTVSARGRDDTLARGNAIHGLESCSPDVDPSSCRDGGAQRAHGVNDEDEDVSGEEDGARGNAIHGLGASGLREDAGDEVRGAGCAMRSSTHWRRRSRGVHTSSWRVRRVRRVCCARRAVCYELCALGRRSRDDDTSCHRRVAVGRAVLCALEASLAGRPYVVSSSIRRLGAFRPWARLGCAQRAVCAPLLIGWRRSRDGDTSCHRRVWRADILAEDRCAMCAPLRTGGAARGASIRRVVVSARVKVGGGKESSWRRNLARCTSPSCSEARRPLARSTHRTPLAGRRYVVSGRCSGGVATTTTTGYASRCCLGMRVRCSVHATDNRTALLTGRRYGVSAPAPRVRAQHLSHVVFRMHERHALQRR